MGYTTIPSLYYFILRPKSPLRAGPFYLKIFRARQAVLSSQLLLGNIMVGSANINNCYH